MNEYFFGVGHGRVSAKKAERVNAIARKHGAHFVAATIPGDGPKFWFATRNEGESFNSRTAQAVHAALEAAEITLP